MTPQLAAKPYKIIYNNELYILYEVKDFKYKYVLEKAGLYYFGYNNYTSALGAFIGYTNLSSGLPWAYNSRLF